MRRWVILAAIGAAVSPAAWAAERPNVLVIITDQQHAGMLSCAGNAYLKTPALDRLAARGVRFERAYCANPVCVPSRVAMITGHYPSRFGVRSNDDSRSTYCPQPAREQALGWLFRRAGYRTVYGGKTHWIRGMTPESLGFEMLTRDQREGLAEEGAAFLREGHDRPFLFVASFINPHDICYMAIDAYARAQGASPAYPASHEPRRRLAQALRPPAGVSDEEFVERLCPPAPANLAVPELEPEAVTTHYLEARPFRLYVRRHWTEQDWRRHRWAYCRLTEMADAHIARLLDALRDAGLERNTLVVFTSDHGDLDGAHRLEHKSIPYEEAARVPLIVVPPGGAARPGTVDDRRLVSAGVDLLPTLCDYAGVRPPAGLPGRSLRPLVEGRSPDNWRDQLVVESRAARMLRTDRYKYILYSSGAHREQLIDLAKDPGELKNVAEAPAYRLVLEEHRRRLADWICQTGDDVAPPLP